MSTNVVSASTIKRDWHLIDAKGQVLGRLAVEVSNKLRGKSKPNFVPYLDMGDYVVLINASHIKVTGKKADQKKYTRHSGYPGGLTVETFNALINRRPSEVIRHAVKGMLPKNKLGDVMITKLHVFSDEEHPFKKQIGDKKQEVKSE